MTEFVTARNSHTNAAAAWRLQQIVEEILIGRKSRTDKVTFTFNKQTVDISLEAPPYDPVPNKPEYKLRRNYRLKRKNLAMSDGAVATLIAGALNRAFWGVSRSVASKRKVCGAIYAPTGQFCSKKVGHYPATKHGSEKPGYEVIWDEEGNSQKIA